MRRLISIAAALHRRGRRRARCPRSHGNPVRGRDDVRRDPAPRLQHRRRRCDERRLGRVVQRNDRHDVLEHRDAVDGVQRHRRRLRGWVATLPGPRPDAVRREERVRLPRADAVVHGLLAERVDRVGEPDRLSGQPVRHEPGAGRHAGVDVRAGARARRRATRSRASRWSSTRAGRSPTRSRRSTSGTSR